MGTGLQQVFTDIPRCEYNARHQKNDEEQMIPMSVLEDIKAEIEALETYEYDDFIRMRAVLDIIDKHISRKERE